ncbi:MAG: response regulator [Nitriliruptorales bacterium]|nr:response regulator [Nitriliruptorales bacterium]
MIRVLITDDNAVIREGVAALLGLHDDLAVVGQAGNGQQAVVMARALRPDVVLLDVRMPVSDGLSTAGPLSRHAKVLMLTYAADETSVTRAIQAGASGYLVHGRFSPEDLVQAVRDVAAGRTVLSPAVAPAVFAAVRGGHQHPAAQTAGVTAREAEVMDQVARGRSNREVAAALHVSEKTVKNHLNHVYAKLGVRRRGEAVAAWLGVGRRDEELHR